MIKIKKRIGVWETNSSSSHSISIASIDKQFVLDTTCIPDGDGVLRINGDEFGWQFAKFNDAKTKADYCAVYSKSNNQFLDMLKEVLQEQTGAYEVEFNLEGGYIDHQSDSVAGVAFTNKKDLRNFIFNLNSWLFTGNDNSSPMPTFYHVGEYKDGKYIDVVYKYRLEIEGIDTNKYKFINFPSHGEIEESLSVLLDDYKYNKTKGFHIDSNYSYYNSRGDYFELELYTKPINHQEGLFYLINSKQLEKECQSLIDEENNSYAAKQAIKHNLLSSKNSPLMISKKFEIVSLKKELAKTRLNTINE